MPTTQKPEPQLTFRKIPSQISKFFAKKNAMTFPKLSLVLALGAFVLSSCISNPLDRSGDGVAAAETGSTEAMPSGPEPTPVPKRLVEHTIEQGDSLWKLARQYETTVKDIQAANHMDGTTIIAGKTILIPTTLPDELLPGAASEAGESTSANTTPSTPVPLRSSEPELLDPAGI